MLSKWSSVAAVVLAALAGGASAACSSARSSAEPPNNAAAAPAGMPAEKASVPWPYTFAADVENTSAECPVPALPDASTLPKIAKLPDPFTKLDGTRMTKRSEWRCRRQELLAQAQKYIYGQKPPRPEKVGGNVGRDSLSIEVEHAGKKIHFSAQVVLPPEGHGPFPAIVNLGAKGPFGGTRLGEDLILDQGVAIIYYNPYDLGKEGKPEASRGLPNPGLFYDLYGGNDSAGLLMAWAWGASRIIDVLEVSGGDIIDPARIGVTGCSRFGKGAFTVGVFDERVALTIPQETSTAALPAYRIVDVTDGAERTNYNFFGLNWLSNDFAPFVENATQLPIDSHEMVALIAPRGLLVLDNPHIAQFAAVASHTAVLAAAEVYRALGVIGSLAYYSNVANEKHCAVGKPEYSEPLKQSIAKFLKHEGGEPGKIEASVQATGDLSKWRDWQTPVLAD
jgi:hypothetical protein